MSLSRILSDLRTPRKNRVYLIELELKIKFNRKIFKKSFFSVEWKKNLSQNLVAFFSLPWLYTETNGYDLELFKDKAYKQYSQNLIQNIPRSKLTQLKCLCIQFICLLPKSICGDWRSHIIGKCVREEPDEEIRICALRYLPYLIYFLGVSANLLVFKLIHPSLVEEKSLNVIKEYGNFLNFICCLISRKSIVMRRSLFVLKKNLLDINDNRPVSNSSNEIVHFELADYFDILCTCCDKKRIDSQIIPSLTRKKNIDYLQSLYNRPKYVDTQVLMQFVFCLSGSRLGAEMKNDIKLNEIKSKLLKNLERALNHLEFNRQLNQDTLVSHDIVELSTKNSQHVNLTFVYKESLNLLGDISLDLMNRFDFSRNTIPKLLCLINSNGSLPPSYTTGTSKQVDRCATNMSLGSNDELISNAMSISIFSLNEKSDPQLDHNFNLENQLCEGVLRAKSSKNLLDFYMYIIALGRFGLSLKKPDEHMFVCVKHLLEIFDDNESNSWTFFGSALAQRQLFILSKRINMQELLAEFEEKVCEIIADTIFKSIQRHQVYYTQLRQQQTVNGSVSTLSAGSNVSTTSYLQNANFSLKGNLS